MGGDLKAILKSDLKLPEESVHDFGRDLAEAVQYTNSRGIIHCDVKPSNVLMNEIGQVKLAGFGLSRTIGEINNGGHLPSVSCISHCCSWCF